MGYGLSRARIAGPPVAHIKRCSPETLSYDGDSIAAHPRRYGQSRNGLAGLDDFAEGLAVGIFTDEAWVDDVPCITR
jgi:hypothetical protein